MKMLKRFFRFSILTLGLVVIAVSFGIAVIFLESDVATAIVTAGSTIFVSVFAAIYARSEERTRVIEQQIRDKKTPIYEQFIRLTFELLFGSKNSPEISPEENAIRKKEAQDKAVKDLQALTPELVVWGADEVIASWVEVRRVSANPTNPMDVMLAYEKFMLMIRRDLGHTDAGLQNKDLLRLFINDIE